MTRREIHSFFFMLCLNLPHLISSSGLHAEDSVCWSNSSITFNPIGPNSFGSVSLKNNGSGYDQLINCNLTLHAPQGYQIHLGFSEISTRGSDFLRVIVDNFTIIQTLSGNWSCPSESYCPPMLPNMQFDGQTVQLQFISTTSTSVKDKLNGFIGMVTVFSIADNHGNCHAHEQFRCHNRHCIWKGLFCNEHNHCGDNSDEPLGCEPFDKQAVWGVLVIIFGAISFCVFLPLFCYFAIRGQRRLRINHSSYQPLPTSINDRESMHYAPVLVVPATYYGTGLQSSGGTSSTEIPVHSQFTKKDPEFQTYH